MPIHDLSYKHWEGSPSQTPPALILGWSQLRTVLKRKIVRFLMLISVLFSLVFVAMVYIETRQAEGNLDFFPPISMNRDTIFLFLDRQRLLHLLICIAAGADLIAMDRRYKALQIYLARPMSVADYLLGKAIPVLVLLSLASWFPALSLVLLKSAMTADVLWLRQTPSLPLAIVGYSVALIVPMTLVTLAISSLSSSPRIASVQLFGLLAVSWGLTEILTQLTRIDAWRLLSPISLLQQMANWLFQRGTPYDFSPWVGLLALLGFAAVSLQILRRRVRPIDVVGGS